MSIVSATGVGGGKESDCSNERHTHSLGGNIKAAQCFPSEFPISFHDLVGDEWLHFLLPSVKVASPPLIAPLTNWCWENKEKRAGHMPGIAFYMSTERHTSKAGNIKAAGKLDLSNDSPCHSRHRRGMGTQDFNRLWQTKAEHSSQNKTGLFSSVFVWVYEASSLKVNDFTVTCVACFVIN